MRRKRKRKTLPSHDLIAIAEQAVKDCRLDIIGWDSCVLAVKVIRDRLQRLGVQSRPIACCTHAMHGDIRVDLVQKETGKPGHVILQCGPTLIDPCIQQVCDIAPEFPQLDGCVYSIGSQTIYEGMTFTADVNGVQLLYVLHPEDDFFKHGLDWNNENIEGFIEVMRGMTDDELRKHYAEFVANDQA